MPVAAQYRGQHEAYIRGPAVLRAAIGGLTHADLTRRSGGSGWSTRDIMVHLSDMELVRSVRIRMMLTEDNPLLFRADEGLWQRRLYYLWRSPEAALTLFEMACFSTAEILGQCGPEAWQRTGIHPDDGEITVARLVERGIRHVAEHAEQIGANRDAATP